MRRKTRFRAVAGLSLTGSLTASNRLQGRLLTGGPYGVGGTPPVRASLPRSTGTGVGTRTASVGLYPPPAAATHTGTFRCVHCGATERQSKWEAQNYVDGMAENARPRSGASRAAARSAGVNHQTEWHRKVKAGMDPDEAFAALPVLPDSEPDAGYQTARLGRDELGLAFSLAWTIAEQNDADYAFGALTPEARYAAFIVWIDKELATPTPAKPAPRPKRVRRPSRSVPAEPAGSVVLGL